MPKKILSIFIDESGDFGKYDIRSPYYYVAMVFHDQSVDISSDIDILNDQIRQIGFHDHAIHSGPLIRREQVYKYELMEKRQMLFRSLFHFTRKLDIKYICPKINKSECNDDILAYIAKLSKTIADELKKHYQYFNSYDLIINYYDYGQAELTKIITSIFTTLFSEIEFRKVKPADYKLFQVADLLCTMELTNDKALKNTLSKSELEFFHSAHHFRKNFYKQIEKKKL